MYDECEDCGHYDCQCEAVTGPAPREKEMDIPDYNQGVIRILGGDDLHAATLESVWERAYFAALTGVASDQAHIESLTDKYGVSMNEIICVRSREIADFSVSAWSAMTAERDALIRKAVEA